MGHVSDVSSCATFCGPPSRDFKREAQERDQADRPRPNQNQRKGNLVSRPPGQIRPKQPEGRSTCSPCRGNALPVGQRPRQGTSQKTDGVHDGVPLRAEALFKGHPHQGEDHHVAKDVHEVELCMKKPCRDRGVPPTRVVHPSGDEHQVKPEHEVLNEVHAVGCADEGLHHRTKKHRQHDAQGQGCPRTDGVCDGQTTANSHPTMKACSKSVNIGHANGTVAMARRACPLL